MKLKRFLSFKKVFKKIQTLKVLFYKNYDLAVGGHRLSKAVKLPINESNLMYNWHKYR